MIVCVKFVTMSSATVAVPKLRILPKYSSAPGAVIQSWTEMITGTSWASSGVKTA